MIGRTDGLISDGDGTNYDTRSCCRRMTADVELHTMSVSAAVLAERNIPRVLRDEAKMMSSEANNLANRICQVLGASMSAATRPAMRGYRMMPESPPEASIARLARAARNLSKKDHDRTLAREVWSLVYRQGHAIPDDVVL